MKRVLVAGFWAALLFAFVMALLPKPPQLPGSPGDKIQHIVAFLTLAVLASAAYPRARIAAIAVGLASFGALIEVAQAIPALHRESSWADWAADCGAVASVLIVRVALARFAVARGARRA